MNDSCYIFDIDGTLIDMREIWEKAYNDLYERHLGSNLTGEEMKSLFGPTELKGHSSILKGRELYTLDKAQELVTDIEEIMLRTLDEVPIEDYVIKGVIPFLNRLYGNVGAMVCATCNLASIGQKIMDRSNLGDYFEIIGCSDDGEDRMAVVSGVLNELAENGKIFEKTKTYLIGDSPSDISTGNELGLVSVGVATGHYGLGELFLENPRILLGDLDEWHF